MQNGNSKNGLKLRFTAVTFITIITLIVVLAVTFASKADKDEVQCLKENVIKLEKDSEFIGARLDKIDAKLNKMDDKLDKIAKNCP